MIKNIFLPEKIGSSFLFGSRVVGIEITPDFIYATQLYYYKTNITMENIYTIEIDKSIADQQDAIIKALETLHVQLPKNIKLQSSLSTNQVIFKELRFPFVEREQIGLVVAYEVEPLLPFTSNDAIIDFIITKTDSPSNSATIIAACAQKKGIAEHVALFAAAGMTPDVITVDAIALYNLYQMSIMRQNESVVFIDIGMHQIKMLFIQEGQLKMVRTLSHGLESVYKSIANACAINTQIEVINSLKNNGLGDHNQAVSQAFTENIQVIIQAIKFTIESYQAQGTNSLELSIILSGMVAIIKNIGQFWHDQTKMACRIFNVQEVENILTIKKNIELLPSHISSLAFGLISPLNEHFSLSKGTFATRNYWLLLQQLTTTLILSGIFIGLLATHYFAQTNKLQREINESTQETIEVLREHFPRLSSENNNLDDLIEEASDIIAKDHETWFAFSYANQSRFLQYLLELTNKIDKEALGFIPERITIVEGTLTLKAQVKDYEALKILERELKSSKLFIAVPPQDSQQFTMQIGLASTSQEPL